MGDIADKDELKKILMKINIHQIGQSIVESQATVEKMRKETRYYPIIPLIIAIIGSSALTAVVTAVVATWLLKQPTRSPIS